MWNVNRYILGKDTTERKVLCCHDNETQNNQIKILIWYFKLYCNQPYFRKAIVYGCIVQFQSLFTLDIFFTFQNSTFNIFNNLCFIQEKLWESTIIASGMKKASLEYLISWSFQWYFRLKKLMHVRIQPPL